MLTLLCASAIPAQAASDPRVEILWHDVPAQAARVAAWKSIAEARVGTFLDYWRAMGAEMPSARTRIYVAPSAPMATADYLRAQLGETGAAQVARAIPLVESITSRADGYRIVTQLDRDLAPLLSDLWHDELEWTQSTPRELEWFKSSVVARLRELTVASAPLAWPTDGLMGLFNYRGPLADNWVLLNNGPGDDYTLPATEYPEVLLHELGHGLHLSLWQAGGQAYPQDYPHFEPTTNELLADFFAHQFLGDPCHVRLKSRPALRRSDCAQQMDVKDRFYADLWSELAAGWHDGTGADGVRALLWKLRTELEADPFARRFVVAVRGLRAEAERQSARFADRKWWRDPFLARSRAMLHGFAEVSAFTRAMCVGTPMPAACAGIETALGVVNEPLVAGLAQSSPTAMIDAGKTWSISAAGGERASQVFTLSFAWSEELEQIVLRVDDGTRVETAALNYGEFERDAKVVYIRSLRAHGHTFRYFTDGHFDAAISIGK